MTAPHHVYLVPGFFGFANFGEFRYFAHVRDFLQSAGLGPIEVHYVPTRPTAGLRSRAARLLETIAATAGDEGPIHLIGHSTGGIDARLVVAPDSDLPTDVSPDPYVDRVSSVVAIASPHRGAPIARALMTVRGQGLLRFVSAMTLHAVRLSSLPMPPVMKVANALSGGRLADVPEGLLDQVFRDVLLDFDEAQRLRLAAFFEDVGRDQSLLPQLTPEAMARFGAGLVDRPTVRYGSVVVQSRPPVDSIAGTASRGPAYALYRALYGLAAGGPSDDLRPDEPAERARLREAFGAELTGVSNDAFVPTWSQAYGDLVYCGWADHLDVVGHFADPTHEPAHVDWLNTGTGFRRPDFEALWGAVARFTIGGDRGGE